jgi:hypothetical protein
MDNFSVKFASGTFYDNITPRRRQEVADSRMIQEDQQAMSNLPTHGFQRLFDPGSFMRPPFGDDEVMPSPRRKARKG